MKVFTDGSLQVNGLRLRYYRTGGAKPPAVLVHGFTDNALYWTRTAEALRPEWDVVMYDARGHGTSDRAGGRFGDAERVADLLGVVQALGLEKPALIGHSLGAATVALAAAQHPDLPRCLVLEDPAWREPPEDETPGQTAERRAQGRAYVNDWCEWVRGLQTATREAGLAQIRERSPNWAESDQNLSLNARLQVELELFDYFPTERMEWRSVLPRIECPVLLLTGDDVARGIVVTSDQAQEAAGLCPHLRWVQIDGAGHSIRYDRFEPYLAAVQAFLSECR